MIRMVPTVGILLAAWLVWDWSPVLVGWLGLGRYELLARVLLMFLALGLAERTLTWAFARFPRLHRFRDDQHDH